MKSYYSNHPMDCGPSTAFVQTHGVLVNPNDAKPSPIAREIQELGKVIDDLGDAIQKLTIKIEPVIQPLAPMPANDNVKEPQPNLPPLGENIRIHRCRLYDLACQVRELTESVQL